MTLNNPWKDGKGRLTKIRMVGAECGRLIEE
jgi:hypothetical protein